MGTALAHLLRADAHTAADAPGNRAGGPAVSRPPARAAGGRSGPGQPADQTPLAGSGAAAGITPGLQAMGQARAAARKLAAQGRPVSRRSLRAGGVKGSNQALNALARALNSELAQVAARSGNPGRRAV